MGTAIGWEVGLMLSVLCIDPFIHWVNIAIVCARMRPSVRMRVRLCVQTGVGRVEQDCGKNGFR